MRLSEIPDGEVGWTPIRVESIITSTMEVWIAPLGTPMPTSYPLDLAWHRVGSQRLPTNDDVMTMHSEAGDGHCQICRTVTWPCSYWVEAREASDTPASLA